MACLKKIQNTEVYGSKFSSRTLTTSGDIGQIKIDLRSFGNNVDKINK